MNPNNHQPFPFYILAMLRQVSLPGLLLIVLVSCTDTRKETEKSTFISNPFMSKSTSELPDSVAKKGKDIFAAYCKICHKDAVNLQAPGLDILNTLTPRAILAAMNNGKMKIQAEKLTIEERKAVAQWITNKVLIEQTFPDSAFMAFSLGKNNHFFDHSGWGGNPEGTGFRSAEQAEINETTVPTLRLKWAFSFPEATQVRSKPAIVGDWLITGSEFGDVFAINRYTGKIGWKFTADAAIRGAVSISLSGNQYTAWFADYSTNVYAIDVATGNLKWKKRAGVHPLSSVTGWVTFFGDKVFVPLSSTEVISAIDPNYPCCTASGEVVALNSEKGDIVWRYRVVDQKPGTTEKRRDGKNFLGPSGAPVWSSPTIDAQRGLLYIGTGENYSPPSTTNSDAIIAIDIKTGKQVWSFQATLNDTWNLACLGDDPNCPIKEGPDLDFGMAPLLARKKDGSEVLLAGQKSGVVFALSPENGKVLWQTRIGKGGQAGGIHWGMATDGLQVYASNADNIRDLDMRDPAIAASPGVYALDIETGKINWKAAAPPCEPGRTGCYQSNSAAPTVIPGVVFAGSLDGHIRAYSAATGKILWDFDTVRDYSCINGFPGKGGALDAAGPVVAGGMLYVNSGYGLFGQIPGNVLLAFEIQK